MKIVPRIFYKKLLFFKSATVLLKSSLNLLQSQNLVLLRKCKYHHNETLFICSIFASMSRPRSVFIASMWSISHIHEHFRHQLYNLMNTDTLVFFYYFLEYVPLFQADLAYKSVSYKRNLSWVLDVACFNKKKSIIDIPL